MRIALCDDCKFHCSINKEYLEKWSKNKNINIEVEQFTSAEEFLFKWTYESFFDVVLLDVNMEGMSGIELATEIRKKDENMIIIFITSEITYALKGYKVQALDFILKPIKEEEFNLALDNAYNKFEKSKENNNYIMLTKSKEKVKIYLNDIIYIAAFDHYIDIHTSEEIYTFKEKIGYIEKVLESDKEFIRCHRSYIINIKHVNKISTLKAYMDNGNEVSISKSRSKETIMEFDKYYKKD